MYQLRQVTPRQNDQKPATDWLMALHQGADRARAEVSVIMTPTRIHRFTFVQFEVIARNLPVNQLFQRLLHISMGGTSVQLCGDSNVAENESMVTKRGKKLTQLWTSYVKDEFELAT